MIRGIDIRKKQYEDPFNGENCRAPRIILQAENEASWLLYLDSVELQGYCQGRYISCCEVGIYWDLSLQWMNIKSQMAGGGHIQKIGHRVDYPLWVC